MKFIVLGSGTAISGSERACSGYLVESSSGIIGLDFGTGAMMNLHTLLQATKLNALFFSHYSHIDHVGDLPAFLFHRKLFCQRHPEEAKQINLFGPTGFEAFVRKIIEIFPFLLHTNFPVNVEEMHYDLKKVFGFTVKSKPVKHGDNAIGFRIEHDGKVIVYSGDTEMCDEIFDLATGADLLVLDCSYSEANNKIGEHLNAKECGEIAKKAGAKKLLLSHIYPEAETHDLVAEAAKNFSGEIILARDLLEIEI